MMADQARQYVQEEEGAAESMQNWVREAQIAADLAFSLHRAADSAEESAQRNATNACYELKDRIQLLEEIDRPDLASPR